VTDGGTASVVAYLQTLGEQHRLIDAHLERFTFAQLSRTELEAAILGEDDEPEPEETEAVEVCIVLRCSSIMEPTCLV
jgi:hypothetical protein